MPTYRCKSCGGIYVDPQASGVLYYHTCPPRIRDAQGTLIPTPNPRDENVRVDGFMNHTTEAGLSDQPPQPRVLTHSPGAGCEMIDADDVVSNADARAIADLHKRPGRPVPDPDVGGPGRKV